MKKLFLKIASLSVGLALAIGVGVALGAEKPVKKVNAASISLLSFSRSGSTDSYTSGATFTKVASGQNGYYQDGSTSSYLQLMSSEALTIPNDAQSVTFKAVIGGGSNRDISDAPVYACLLDSNGWSISNTTFVVTSKITSTSGREYTIDYSAFIGSSSVYGVRVYHAKITGYNIRYYSFSLEYTSAGSTPTISLDKQEVTVGTDMTEGVTLTMQDLTGNVFVSQTGTGSLLCGSEIVKDNDNPYYYSFSGENVGDVTLTFTSDGAEEQTLLVHVLESTRYRLVAEAECLTPGSSFIVIGNNNLKHGVLSTTLNSGYYNSANVALDGFYANALYANEFTVEVDENGMLLKSGEKYVGTNGLDSSSNLVANADLTKVAYPYWKISIDSKSQLASIVIDTEDEGNNKLLNYNPDYNRFKNYTTSNPSFVYIYSANLIPTVTVEDSEITLDDNAGGVYDISYVNFGFEEVTLTATSNDTDVCTAEIVNDRLEVSAVAPGETTIVVEAQSENYGPATFTVQVTIVSSTRTLTGIALSVLEETLYKDQAFSYSGVITAIYDTGDEIPLDHSDVTFTGYSMDIVGDYTVSVTYTDKVSWSRDYTLHVVEWTGELTVGSYYVLAAMYTEQGTNYNFAMVGLGKINTANVGLSAEFSSTLRSESAMLLEDGNTYNSYAFKLGNGKYIAADNNNSLIAADTVTDASSWTVTADGNNYTITNVAFSGRSIRYNSGSPRFATYTSGQKAVTLVEVDYTGVINDFIINFLHPEIETSDERDTGACRGENGYYALAKVAFNIMPAASRDFFLNSSMYPSYKARLEAWAIANGDEFDAGSNLLITNASAINYYDATNSNNTTMISIIVIASVSAVSLAALLVIKKRKHN